MGLPPSEHKNVRVKVQNDVRLSKRTNKLSPIFNCVTTNSVLLANYSMNQYLSVYNCNLEPLAECEI